MVVEIFKKLVVYVMSIIVAITAPIHLYSKGEIKVTKPDEVKLSFATMSDIHMRDISIYQAMIELGFSDLAQSEEKLDSLVLVGDNTNMGQAEEYDRLVDSMSKYDLAKNIIMAEGNHDTWTEEGKYDLAKDYFIDYTNKITGNNIDNVYYSVKLNGYTFIVLGSETRRTAAYISDAQLQWLNEQMEVASKDGKPIFVISHWPINGTHGLPELWGDKNPEPGDGGLGDQSDQVNAILQQYKDVFYICGHTHLGISTNDKLYTYKSIEKVGNVTSIMLPSLSVPSFTGEMMNGCGFIFEVYDDEILVRGRNYYTSVWYDKYEFSLKLGE